MDTVTIASYSTRPDDLTLPTLPPRLDLDWRICHAQALMRRHLHRKVTIGELATAAGLSVSRFSHLFKNQSGDSPVRYLKHLRLQVARKLLEGSPLSVKEVAWRVGLDSSRLIKEFRETYGQTPLQYRFRWMSPENGRMARQGGFASG